MRGPATPFPSPWMRRASATVVLLSQAGAAAAQTQNTTYHYQYDANGNLTQITDPLGRITTQSYDALNRRRGMDAGDQLQRWPIRARRVIAWRHERGVTDLREACFTIALSYTASVPAVKSTALQAKTPSGCRRQAMLEYDDLRRAVITIGRQYW